MVNKQIICLLSRQLLSVLPSCDLLFRINPVPKGLRLKEESQLTQAYSTCSTLSSSSWQDLLCQVYTLHVLQAVVECTVPHYKTCNHPNGLKLNRAILVLENLVMYFVYYSRKKKFTTFFADYVIFYRLCNYFCCAIFFKYQIFE